MVELDLDNDSFYSFPSINPTNTDNPSDGPIKGIPGREVRPRESMTAMARVISGNTRISPTPENDPRKWNGGGDGTWWSEVNGKIIDESKKPIND